MHQNAHKSVNSQNGEMMYHIGIDLTKTAFAHKFKSVTEDNNLIGPVKSSYLHVSLAILTASELTEAQLVVVDAITQAAAAKLSGMSHFRAKQLVTDEHGYVMLEIEIDGMNDIIEEMLKAFEGHNLAVKDKRPLHTTIVKAKWSDPPHISTQEHLNMNSVLRSHAIKDAICNQVMELEGAVFGRLRYPKDMKDTVEVAKSYFEFSENNKLEESTRPKRCLSV